MASKNHENFNTEKVCQNDGQRVEKGWKMEPKWHPKSSKNQYKIIEQTWKYEGVEPWKSLFFLRKNIHFTKNAFYELGQKTIENIIKNYIKINEKSILKSIQNRGAEKHRKMMPNCRKRYRKCSPKGPQKVDKIDANFKVWKSSKFSGKNCPGIIAFETF